MPHQQYHYKKHETESSASGVLSKIRSDLTSLRVDNSIFKIIFPLIENRKQNFLDFAVG
jgi:hypothetical protein